MSRSHLARRGLTAACVAGTLAVSGCAAREKAPESPELIVHAFARALSDGKLQTAYDMMSPAYRGRVSFAEFRKLIEANPQEVIETSNTLAHVTGPADVRATLRAADGRSLTLTRSGSSWTIGPELVEFYDQSTPRSALRAFIDALERRRYDVVLRLMPEADKEGVTTESMEKAWGHAARDDIERMLSLLRDNLEAAIEVVGDRATMPYADHKRVQFLREDGLWKIEDPE